MAGSVVVPEVEDWKRGGEKRREEKGENEKNGREKK